MAERTLTVCDICGEPAQQSVTFKVAGRSLVQDLCGAHLQELVRLSHAPKRGRKPGALSTRSSSPKPSIAKSRGRRLSSSPSKREVKKSARRRITDPAVLEKRRAALAKARDVLAKKRAAAG